MKTIIGSAALALTASLLFAQTAAQAHHSFPAEYDVNKPITLTGTVTKVEWTNPHIFIYMDAADQKAGEPAHWKLELGSPNSLMRLGWKRDDLKAGDVVTVEGSLARDGSPLVNAQSIVMTSTGKKMLAGSSRGASDGGQQ